MLKKLSDRPLFLASVSCSSEAVTALLNGAEIIDCKNPTDGPLGALPCKMIDDIVKAVKGRVPVSATIGNTMDDPDATFKAASHISETGVDFIKVGFYATGDSQACILRLKSLIENKTKIVGLFFAEVSLSFHYLSYMAKAGFAGVMLDTFNKKGAALPDLIPNRRLRQFINLAHQNGMFAGLAGSLRINHLDNIIRLNPDIIGLRGALCNKGIRENQIDKYAVVEIAKKFRSIDCSKEGTMEEAIETRP